jgi:hypothetical protein
VEKRNKVWRKENKVWSVDTCVDVCVESCVLMMCVGACCKCDV